MSFEEQLRNLEARFQQPAGFEWSSFEREPGRKIRYGYNMPASGKIDYTVFDFPGLNDPVEKQFELYRALEKQNVAVFAMEWMGQVGSARYLDDQRRHSDGFNKDLIDARHFMHYVAPPLLHKFDAAASPKVMKAHSMGGHLGLRLLAQEPDFFERATISAPMIEVLFPIVPYKARLAVAQGLIRVKGAEAYSVRMKDWDPQNPDRQVGSDRYSSDPSRSVLHNAWMSKNPTGGPTNQWIYDAHISIKELYREIDQIETPTTIGVPMDEVVVDSEATIAAFKNVGAVKLLIMDDAKHELWNEADIYRDPMIDALLGHSL